MVVQGLAPQSLLGLSHQPRGGVGCRASTRPPKKRCYERRASALGLQTLGWLQNHRTANQAHLSLLHCGGAVVGPGGV